MTVITEHHSEEEGEGDDSERSGVSFAVGGYTVHVGDLLEGTDHVVSLEVGRRVQYSAVDFLVVVTVGFEGSSLELIEFAMNIALLFMGSPEETNEGVATLFHLVEASKYSLLLDDEPSVHLKSADAVGERSLSGVVQTGEVVFDSLSRFKEHLLGFADAGFGLSNEPVNVSDFRNVDLSSHEGVAHLLDTEFVLGVVVEDD